ncbi:MAG: RidA family protein [Bacteroidales bacterium]
MKKIIVTEKSPRAIGPYSQAVEVGSTLYISGQIPLDPVTNEIVEGGIREQTEQVLKNIGLILTAAGYSFSDVVKTTCMLADINDFAAMNEVYAKYFVKDFPARSTFQAAALPKGVRVEIEVIAAKK